MILIADSGSTKTTWSIIENKSNIQTCETSGINPFFLNEEGIFKILETEFSLSRNGISLLYFYGAGCIPSKISVLSKVLESYFGTDHIEVNSDLLAAARSLCKDQAGIACILGTGSNSGYYDGKTIVKNVSPLGFILGDEGSGAVLGKKLIADLLKNQMPNYLKEDFLTTYPVNQTEILENVYQKPFPNRFLAQYTRFIHKHMNDKYISELVETSFREFVVRNLFQYEEIHSLSVHFTGSIAYFFKDNLKRVIDEKGLKLGKIAQTPMDGLIKFHLHYNS